MANCKTLFIISIIIALCGLTFGIISFVKSFNSTNNFQAPSKNFCIPCINSSGNSYTNTDGTSVPCRTLQDWLLSNEGIDLLKKLGINIKKSDGTSATDCSTEQCIANVEQSETLQNKYNQYSSGDNLITDISLFNFIKNSPSFLEINCYINPVGNNKYEIFMPNTFENSSFYIQLINGGVYNGHIFVDYNDPYWGAAEWYNSRGNCDNQNVPSDLRKYNYSLGCPFLIETIGVENSGKENFRKTTGSTQSTGGISNGYKVGVGYTVKGYFWIQPK